MPEVQTPAAVNVPRGERPWDLLPRAEPRKQVDVQLML